MSVVSRATGSRGVRLGIAVCVALLCAGAVAGSEADWTSFRNGGQAGPIEARPPLKLEAPAWSFELPGFGQSSPVVHEGVVYVTSVTGAQKETIWMTAFDLADGSELWRRSWASSEPMKSSEMIARAAPTPAVDGERVTALFGSGDLLAVNHDGKLEWRRNLAQDYGSFTGNHGVANSVLLTDSAAVVLLARKTYSYLLAVDRATGETLWKTDRGAGVSWTTPTLSPEGSEIVVSSNGSVEGYDARSGERLWIVEDVKSNTSQSPVVTDDLVLVAGADAAANFAIRRGQRGTLGDDALLWRGEATSNFGSPVLTDMCGYWVNKAGVAHCIDPANGKALWRHRLAQSTWATPIVAEGRVYFFGDEGAIEVLRDSRDGAEVLARTELELDHRLHAALAVGRTLLLRSGNRVLAFRSAPEEAP